MNDLGVLDPMELEKSNCSSSSSCSICLELVVDHGERSIARLHCGHDFHLDCIGSAFNAKGAMQCPNCRKVEKGRWLYANGHRSSSDFDLDGLMTEDFYDLSYSELPFGFQWCPFRGFTQLASLFEEGESQLNSYHESLGSTTFGDQPSAPNSSHVCPYLALHGFPHHMHGAAPSSSADSLPENNLFPRHLSNFRGGQPSADMLNSHSYPPAEPQNHNWQQQHSLPFSLLGNAADQSAAQFAPSLSRSDASSQQRLGSFVHPHPLVHGSVPRTGSNLMSSLGPPLVGDARVHTHTRGHGNSHMYQQSMPSSTLRNSPFPPIRRPRPRPRPRVPTLVSSLPTTTSSSAEVGGFYDFASVSSSANSRSHQEAENARHFDRFYGWGGRESFTSLPWIPLDGETQWWGPFNPNNQTPQSGGSFLQRPANGERVAQSRPENGFQRMPQLPRMPQPPYM